MILVALLLLILTIIALSIVGMRMRYEKWSDFIKVLLQVELISIIGGLGMSAVAIGYGDPFSFGFESTDQKLQVVAFITGFYIVTTPLTLLWWFTKHRKWIH